MAATNLLDLLGLNDPAAAIIAAATGGTVGPPGQAPVGQRTGDTAAQDGSPQMASVAQVLGLQRKGALRGLTAQQLKGLEGALNRQGQAREAGGAGRIGEKLLAKFGGQVIGTGRHGAGDAGHAGDFAVVLRDGKLWHVYGDGTKQQLDAKDSGVARALSPLHAKSPLGHFSAGGGNGTGGAQAPAGVSPSSRLNGGPVDPRTGGRPGPGEQIEANRVPLDPLTGGALAPSEDGTSQAAAATQGDVPMTAAEAYRKRLMAAHAALGLG